MIILDPEAHASLGGTVPADVARAPAAVAGLGAGAGAVPGHVPHLVAVVAGVRLLTAVPGDVAAAVALVAPLLLLATLPGEVAKSSIRSRLAEGYLLCMQYPTCYTCNTCCYCCLPSWTCQRLSVWTLVVSL